MLGPLPLRAGAMPATKRELEATTSPAAKTARGRGRGRGNGRGQHATGRGTNASGSSAQGSTAAVAALHVRADGCINAALDNLARHPEIKNRLDASPRQ